MILQALAALYDRLAAMDRPQVAQIGFAPQGISACLVLDQDGTVAGLEDMRERAPRGHRMIPVDRIVPDYGEKRTSRDRPNLLWDNTEYVFGVSKDPKDAKRAERRFKDFRDLHLRELAQLDDPAVEALRLFLIAWSPDRYRSLPYADEFVGGNIVFRLNDPRLYLHDCPAARNAWMRLYEKRESTPGICLVTGRHAQIARLHPAIKGVRDPGGQAEKGIVAINKDKDAFDSYGKKQSYNAPVGVVTAAKYSAALNHLLADDAQHKVIADTTIVWWTDRPTEIEDLFGNLLDSGGVAQDAVLADRIRRLIEQIREISPLGAVPDASVPFYLLGLSPSTSRIIIRCWLDSSVAELAGRLKQHFADLDMTGTHVDDIPPSLGELVGETVIASSKTKLPDYDRVAPQLSGEILSAVLRGSLYPAELYCGVLRRIRAEGFADRDRRKDWMRSMYRRAAILKACLQRRYRLMKTGKEIPVSLDTARTDAAYLLGRLFAALEKVQEESAEGKLNRTVKDSYFGSASATPATLFPRLLRLSHHHQRKLRQSRPHRAVYFDRLLQEVMSPMGAIPRILSVEDQGVFYIGYYHQRQDFFARKEQPENGK
ncbi:MAG: type I-C CRISPR-associated protein Cas8c/Csd1 [Planctomycetota bacterium]|nr:type I-C CRISPR-associated protein Cas8c/Csd1 [Planctomycetota bacterium]